MTAERSTPRAVRTRTAEDWQTTIGSWRSASTLVRSGCAVGAGLAITGVVTGGLPLASGLAIAALLPAVLVDTQQRRLPDVWILDAAILLIVALGISWATGSSTSSPAAPIAGAVLMTAPLLLLHLVSPSAMGFGDVKLAVVLGAAVGALDWQLAIPALALAAGATATVGVVTRARTIAFGPALLAGALVATLASDLLVTVTST